MHQAEHDRAVAECFDPHNGGERDCGNCIANPDAGGGCCFGEKHEYGDQECHECIHEADCAPIVHNQQPPTPRRSSRVLLRRGTITNNSRSRLPVVSNRQRGENRSLLAEPVKRTPVKRQQEEQEEADAPAVTFVGKLGRQVGWGMAEGGLQMALNFFTRNRPED